MRVRPQLTLRLHLVWAVRRLRPVLVGEAFTDLQAALSTAAARVDARVESLRVEPEHVRLTLQAPSDLSANQLVWHLKQSSARVLRRHFAVRRGPSVWTGAYLGSSEPLSEQAVSEFLAAQSRRD